MTTLNFCLRFCSYKWFFSKNCYNDDYCHPLAPVMQSCSYLKGQIIRETLILKICIVPPENAPKGVIQAIWNVYSHPNPVPIASPDNLNEIHFKMNTRRLRVLSKHQSWFFLSHSHPPVSSIEPIFLEHDGTNIFFSFLNQFDNGPFIRFQYENVQE